MLTQSQAKSPESTATQITKPQTYASLHCGKQRPILDLKNFNVTTDSCDLTTQHLYVDIP